jgi:hypothetical protein
MKIPGFTAEASAYPSPYRYVTGTPRWSVNSGVELAAPFCHRGRPGCVSDCLRHCTDLPEYCAINCDCCCFGRTPTCYQ